jgi:hypothetical protein
MSVSPDNVFGVFHRAFISPDYGELKRHPQISRKACVILLYNMGLAWRHGPGEQRNGPQSPLCLRGHTVPTSQFQRQYNGSFSYLDCLFVQQYGPFVPLFRFGSKELPRIYLRSLPAARTSSIAAERLRFFFFHIRAIILETRPRICSCCMRSTLFKKRVKER